MPARHPVLICSAEVSSLVQLARAAHQHCLYDRLLHHNLTVYESFHVFSHVMTQQDRTMLTYLGSSSVSVLGTQLAFPDV